MLSPRSVFLARLRPAETETQVIRASLETARAIVDLHARRHLAVLAVALASGVTSGIAGIAGQLPAYAAITITTLLFGLAISQIRALGRLTSALQEANAAACQGFRGAETLMKLEDETDDDDPEDE
jgi:hypothetical protein